MSEQQLTVYFDGSCPLCRWEIDHYRKRDRAGRICLQDVSRQGAEPGPDLTQRQAMARLHVRTSNGELLSGATAFVAIWQVLPGWRWAARIGKLRVITGLLEVAYRAFLPLRPRIARLARNRAAAKPDRSTAGEQE